MVKLEYGFKFRNDVHVLLMCRNQGQDCRVRKKSVHACSNRVNTSSVSSSGEQSREKLETLGCPGFSLPARDKVGGLQPFETSFLHVSCGYKNPIMLR